MVVSWCIIMDISTTKVVSSNFTSFHNFTLWSWYFRLKIILYYFEDIYMCVYVYKKPRRQRCLNETSKWFFKNSLLVDIVNALTRKSSSHVNNSENYMESSWSVLIYNNEIVSLYIVSLFTRVPLLVIWNRLESGIFLEECTSIHNLMEMLTFCIHTSN